MGRGSNKLTDREVRNKKKPGRYGDGLGLWLQVSTTGTKAWLFRYMLDGKARWMGLGAANIFTLAEARESRDKWSKVLKQGGDPIAVRDAERAASRVEAAKTSTFDECAAAYINAHRSGWKNDKHVSQWENTLKTYASPIFGDLPVTAIDTGMVMRVLEPIWKEKTETATRLRGRLESILGWATVRGYRQGDNPARWKDHLDHQLPARSKVAKVRNHPALPYTEISTFINALRAQPGIAARALELAILTAARTGEAIGATWQEFDLEAGVWTIQAERMKGKKEHRVPLPARAVEIAKEMLPLAVVGGHVFPAPRGGALSNMAMLAVLKRMGRDDLTVHGFRSTFRDWAGETTAYPREVIEHALAHQLKDKAEAAYARGTLFAKRRKLMDDWAKYCGTPSAKGGEVVPINKSSTAA